ncbi:hypothetical protein K8S19_12645 [bacterium]|nr:hypothetical protein [bacterium]
MNHYATAQLLNSIIVPILGFYVFFKNHRSTTNLTFFLHSLALSVWSFSFFKMALSQNSAEGLFWSRALHVGAALIPAFFMHFVLSILKINVENKKIIKLAYLIGFIVLIFVPTNYLVSHTIEIVGFKYFVGPAGLHYHLFPIYFILCVIYSFIKLFTGYKHATGLHKTQLKYLFLAFFIGYSGGPGGFLPLYNIHIPEYSFYSVVLYCLIIGYVIIRYRLFDIEIILKKLYYFLAILIISSLLISSLYFGYSLLTASPIDLHLLIIMILGTFLITSLINRYRHQLDAIADKAINTKRRKLYNSLQKTTDRLNAFTSSTELSKYLCTELFKQLQVRYTAIYHYDKTSSQLKKEYQSGKADLPATMETSHDLIQYFYADTTILETESLRHTLQNSSDQNNGLLALIDRNFKASLFIPLTTHKKLTGILLFGYHTNRIGFTNREINILRNLGIQVSLVLENITLYDQIIKENRLELIGTMATSLAHEIRNPLTSIRTFVEMLPTKTNDKKFMDQFNKLVPGEIERLLELTNSTLNFSSNNDPVIQETHFQVLFDKTLVLLKNHLREKKIQAHLSIQGPNTILVDPNQFLQVLLNILLNAIQASVENDRIDVELRNEDAATAIITITDHGCGISPQNTEKIFEPFYSSKIYGTGLGLTNCLRIIESHQGRLTVESEPEKGSKFTITLPQTHELASSSPDTHPRS